MISSPGTLSRRAVLGQAGRFAADSSRNEALDGPNLPHVAITLPEQSQNAAFAVTELEAEQEQAINADTWQGKAKNKCD